MSFHFKQILIYRRWVLEDDAFGDLVPTSEVEHAVVGENDLTHMSHLPDGAYRLYYGDGFQYVVPNGQVLAYMDEPIVQD